MGDKVEREDPDVASCTYKRGMSGSTMSSSNKTASTVSVASKQTTSSAPSESNPQKWHVVDYGGAVVRVSEPLVSKKVGTIRQNEEISVVKVIGRRLCVANPVDGRSLGWISAETEGGLKIVKRICDMDESQICTQTSLSRGERFLRKIGL